MSAPAATAATAASSASASTSASLPAPSQQQQQPPSQAEPPTITQIYTALQRYPFAHDAQYQAGLAEILGHADEPLRSAAAAAHRADLELQAQCFYFARKFNVEPVEPAAYAAWLSEQQQEIAGQSDGRRDGDGDASIPQAPPATASTATPAAAAPQDSTDQGPPYPTSFAAIVDLITRNIPVPGIEEIPTTVLEPGSSKVDKTPRRRKPWEKDGEGEGEGEAGVADDDDGLGSVVEAKTGGAADHAADGEASTAADATVDVDGRRETGTGVVNILKPNAVPDSGLLGKD